MPSTGEKRDQSEKGQHGEQKHSSEHGQVPRDSDQGGQKHNPGEHGGQTGREGITSKKNQEQRNDRKKERGQKNR